MIERMVALLSQVPVTSNTRILEIGPLMWPTFEKYPEIQVDYLDYLNREDLIKTLPKETWGSNIDRIPPITYVVQSYENYTKVIKKKYDLIIANHVIEHICNPIGFLNAVAELLKPNGIAFLAVPDKRYTFDFLRSCSTKEYIEQCFRENSKMPNFETLFDIAYNTRYDIKCFDCYTGAYRSHLEPKISEPQAKEHVERQLQTQTVCHNHCHVYTSDSFSSIFSPLLKNVNAKLRLSTVIDVPFLQNEFYAFFHKTFSTDRAKNTSTTESQLISFDDGFLRQTFSGNTQLDSFGLKLSAYYIDLSLRLEVNNLNNEALTYTLKALEHENNNANLYHRVASIEMKCGNLDKAQEVQQAAIALNPNDALFHYQLSHIHARRRNTKDAVASAQKAVCLALNNPEYLNHFGNLLIQDDRLDEAEQAQRDAILLDPNLPLPHFQLSHIYTKRKNYDEAVRKVKDAISLDPSCATYYDHLANLMDRIGATQDALRMRKRAFELKSK